MRLLGTGLYDARRYTDSLIVQQTELAMLRRIGATEGEMLTLQGNLANAYEMAGHLEDALCTRQDVYYGKFKLLGEEHIQTLIAAFNYAGCLLSIRRFEEARAQLRKTLPVARRVLGEGHRLTLKMRRIYAQAMYKDDAATLDDLREAVTKLEDLERIGRRVLGATHPLASGIEKTLQDARAALRARGGNG